MNPFIAMAERYPQDARRLAQCFVASESFEQVYACCRFERRMLLDHAEQARQLSGYLDGRFFVSPACEPVEDRWEFDELKDFAWAFLEPTALKPESEGAA